MVLSFVKAQWSPDKESNKNCLLSHRPDTELHVGCCLTLSGREEGGNQRPGWPNSQLTIKNLLLYDAETRWLLIFILKAHSDQILAKLINQWGCCCSFVIETSQKFLKWKNFPLLENCWNWHGGQFWVEKNDSGHKNLLFLKLKPFSGGKQSNRMTCSLLLRDLQN